MDLDKVFKYKDFLQEALSFEEISKIYREILYEEYKELDNSDQIHTYQILRDLIDIFTQMRKGRDFDQKYLKDKIKW